jgi:hypothetical protein
MRRRVFRGRRLKRDARNSGFVQQNARKKHEFSHFVFGAFFSLRMAGASVLSCSFYGMLMAVAVIPTAAQSTAYKGPRGPDGKPNLNGIWQVLNTANWDIQTHAARPALMTVAGPVAPIPAPSVLVFGAVGAVPGGIGVVEGDEIPYQPWAASKKKENAEHWLTSDPEIKCYLPGVPRTTYMPFPFQIVQSAKVILISYEFAGATRTINMGTPTEAQTESWMGWSNGRWEGDTLVVDVTGQNDKTWFDRAGNFHSDALHVVERYTPRSADTMMYEATIEDSKVFTRPWKVSMPLYRRVEKNAQIVEFNCVEFVEELLYGQFRKK